jgi:hypothetical protein
MFRLAIAEAPNTREPWVGLAEICYRMGMWLDCYSSCKSALAITNKELVYTMDPTVWEALPHDLCSIAAWNLGFKEEAIEMVKKALEFEPTNQRFLNNLKSMK